MACAHERGKAGMMAQGKLTPKQEAFLFAYIGEARFNATKAARIAGYKDPRRYGSDLRTNPDISSRIDDELNARALKASEVLAELTDVATADWRDFIEARVVADNKGEDEPVTVRVRFDLSAKIKSLELLGKHHQLFSDNLNINGGIEIREYIGIPEDAP